MQAKRLNLWHRRLCHFDISHIKNKLLKLNTPVNQCPICMNLKLKNKPYKQAISRNIYLNYFTWTWLVLFLNRFMVTNIFLQSSMTIHSMDELCF